MVGEEDLDDSYGFLTAYEESKFRDQTSHAGARGLAMLRLDRVADARAAGTPLIAGGVPIEPRKPDWARFDWPGEQTGKV